MGFAVGTVDEWLNWPTSWSGDNQSVLFTSDRGGRLDIFRQSVKTQTPVAVVSGGEERREARITADGRWIMYLTLGETSGQGQAAEGRLMRVSPGGGPPALVLSWPGIPTSRGCRPRVNRPDRLCWNIQVSDVPRSRTRPAY